ncbi:hypothetical protein [Streptomyces sp. MBT53]|uniref:hypothetical protein n=1 Tax=Streptomyces sp. MBT53 TaxID=1488384 RepID=UPI0019136A98|nr:hypothetical protein [Streptomyces sp. MBT53]MBK6013081.1 hypothetical protein [Streptomyces sp. MBT53]
MKIDDDPACAIGSDSAEPAKPRTPRSERFVAWAWRAKAHELIERLVAVGRVRITDPDDDEIAEWRRVVDHAKRHGLEPAGKRVELCLTPACTTWPDCTPWPARSKPASGRCGRSPSPTPTTAATPRSLCCARPPSRRAGCSAPRTCPHAR